MLELEMLKLEMLELEMLKLNVEMQLDLCMHTIGLYH